MALKGNTCVILLGKTGNGKSSTGNSILQTSVFKDKASAESVTEKCSLGESSVNGQVFTVVDTPGIFDSKKPLFATALEIQRSLQLLESRGKKPHVYLLILSIANRFTEEEKMTIDYLRMIFGDEMVRRTIVVFTSKSRLDGKKLHEYYNGSDLEKVLVDFGKRVVTIENTNGDGMKDLYKMIAVIQTTENVYDDDWRSHKKVLEDMVKEGFDLRSKDLNEKLTSALQRISEIRKWDERWQVLCYGGMVLGAAALSGAVIIKPK